MKPQPWWLLEGSAREVAEATLAAALEGAAPAPNVLGYLEGALAPKEISRDPQELSFKALSRCRRRVLEIVRAEIHRMPPVAQAVLRDIEEVLL